LYRSEIGAFSVVGRDALRPGHSFICDFRSFVLTREVRLVHISKVSFLEALVLDRSKQALAQAAATLAGEQAGEVDGPGRFNNPRRTSRDLGEAPPIQNAGEFYSIVPLPSDAGTSFSSDTGTSFFDADEDPT